MRVTKYEPIRKGINLKFLQAGDMFTLNNKLYLTLDTRENLGTLINCFDVELNKTVTLSENQYVFKKSSRLHVYKD